MASLARISMLIEEPALHRVANQSERCLEVLARRCKPSASKLKLAQRTGIEGIGSQTLAVGDRADLFEPTLAPSICATAMARLSATIGEGRIVIKVS
jgi:hypothetical protein